MTRETFVINGKEYNASKIPAFPANGIILKLQKIILPILAAMGGDHSAMNMDVKVFLFKSIAERLDDSVMSEIVLPTFKLSVVSSKEDNCKIDSEQAINKVFKDADGLTDFYELIYEVLKYNFEGFFMNIGRLIGDKLGSKNQMASITTESENYPMS